MSVIDVNLGIGWVLGGKDTEKGELKCIGYLMIMGLGVTFNDGHGLPDAYPLKLRTLVSQEGKVLPNKRNPTCFNRRKLADDSKKISRIFVDDTNKKRQPGSDKESHGGN